MLDVEAALAKAKRLPGSLPETAANAIARAAQVEVIDVAAVLADAQAAGTSPSRWSGSSPGWWPWTSPPRPATCTSATSQDIIDTGLVLQLGDAVPLVVRDVAPGCSGAADHAGDTPTPMAGRTWLQQATPVTFGLKAAGWLDALARTADGIEAALASARVLQFGGASGTLASLGAMASTSRSWLGAIRPAGARHSVARASRPAPPPWRARSAWRRERSARSRATSLCSARPRFRKLSNRRPTPAARRPCPTSEIPSGRLACWQWRCARPVWWRPC
jgi:hypothetical protein